ncbi:phage baseplate plug family protein [Phytobacter diazotrophicus]|uniref:phage baseplate plug family protein n=1 Tax=Phytobacter diazotrophicus TaxID=395631 RepID=UPI002FF46B45
MNISEIPLSPDNGQFSVSIAGKTYLMRVVWREPCWYLDLLNADQSPIALALPLITGADLLAQYSYLGLGFSLVVGTDIAGQEYPTKTDLGITSHLYVVTE